MKQVCAIILALSLMGPNCLVPQQAQGQTVVMGGLMVAATIAVGWVLIRVYDSYNTPRWRTLVLQADKYDGNWVNLATNNCFVPKSLRGATQLPVFAAKMTDFSAQYRVMEIATQQNNVANPNHCGVTVFVY